MRSRRPEVQVSPSSEKTSSDERRVERRIPSEGRGEITWVDQDARRHRHAVLLRDVSPGGRGVTVQQPVPVGQNVVVVLGDEIPAWGVTRYCRAVDGGYQVGIQLPRESAHR